MTADIDGHKIAVEDIFTHICKSLDLSVSTNVLSENIATIAQHYRAGNYKQSVQSQTYILSLGWSHCNCKLHISTVPKKAKWGKPASSQALLKHNQWAGVRIQRGRQVAKEDGF